MPSYVKIILHIFVLIIISSRIVFANDVSNNIYANSIKNTPQDSSFQGAYLDSIFKEPQPDPDTKKRKANYLYAYKDRDHSLLEDIKNQGLLYGLGWAFYPITQPKILKGNGGFDTYGNNFGKLVFDKDEPFWNWFVHPISGSQLYLFYRADGYARVEAFKMAFITSLLFEFTIEIFTEPASVQDLYQTPVLGSILGLSIENFSMYLLNTGHPLSMFFGHLINPATLLPIYEGKTIIAPTVNSSGSTIDGLSLQTMVSF